MKYLIISDVHEDYSSLSFLLSSLKDSYDCYICLGDVLGNNGRKDVDYEKCLKLLKNQPFVITFGNHDIYHMCHQKSVLFEKENAFCRYIRRNINVGGWDYSSEEIRVLSDEELIYLSSQAPYLKASNALFSHYIISDICGLRNLHDDNKTRTAQVFRQHLMNMLDNGILVSFLGHTHFEKAVVLSQSLRPWCLDYNEDYKLVPGAPVVVFCPPLFRSGRISWLSYDSDSASVSFFSIIRS